MLLAPKAGAPPRDVAGRLAEELEQRLGAALERVEVAGPGFLNLFMSDEWCVAALAHVLAAGDAFGGGGAEPVEQVNVEFVSANPTGPMTAAGARHAAYGDSLARLLEFRGHEVTREYYINDIGGQVRRLGESIQARARGEEVPEGGYEGDYVRELARRIPGAATDDVAVVAERGVLLLLDKIRASMHAIGVDFDVWFSEALAARGRAVGGGRTRSTSSSARGESYRSEGALWLRTTRARRAEGRRPGALDRRAVLLRVGHRLPPRQARARLRPASSTSGAPITTATSRRMHAAFEALGGAAGPLELIIMQFVNIVERGERASMSKRRGDFVTLDELIAQIGVDAVRFFMLQRSHDTTVDLDLDLARAQSSENPVYYVQYAHARIASILAKAGGARRVPAAIAEAAGFARRAGAGRAHADQEAARLPRRGRRGDRAARAAPDRRLRARAGADVHGVLPRLPGRRGRGRGRHVVPARAERRDEADDRAGARPARGQRAGQDVAGARRRQRSSAARSVVEARTRRRRR